MANRQKSFRFKSETVHIILKLQGLMADEYGFQVTQTQAVAVCILNEYARLKEKEKRAKPKRK